jgi:glycogen(starch) synthase
MDNKKSKDKICFLVSNDLTHDPRVQKQALTGARYGYDTLVLAWMTFENSKFLIKEENNRGYRVIRGTFMPHWTRKNYFLLNCRLAFSYWPVSLAIISFSVLKFVRYFKSVILYCLVLLAKVRNLFFSTLKKVLLRILGLVKAILKRLKKVDKFKNSETPTATLKKSVVVENKSSVSTPRPLTFRQRLASYNFLMSLARFVSLVQFYIKYYVQLNKFLITEGIKFSPTVVHANDLDTLWAGWQIKKKTGAKLVYDAHEIWTEQGLNLPKALLNAYGWLECYLFRKIDMFVTVNDSIAQELKRRYKVKNIETEIVYNSPLFVKSNFVPVKLDAEVKVLYQGRYSVDRGLEELVEAAKYFSKNIKLYFRGTGSEETLLKLKHLVEKMQLSDRVFFYEPVPMSDLIVAARTFDIGVVAYIPKNINNYFCLPNKIYEYMMAGLALAVSNLPELRRVIKENNNGITFDPSNPKDIAKKINLLASDIVKLNQAKKNSLIGAKLNNWGQEEKKLKAIYEKLTT